MRTQNISSKAAPSPISPQDEKATTAATEETATTASTSTPTPEQNNNLTKMMRVSSRQRLVSWDAFDASTLDLSIETFYEPPSSASIVIPSSPRNSSTSEEQMQSLCESRSNSQNNRKRNRVERSIKSSKTSYPSASTAVLGFDNVLCNDVQLHIVSYLKVTDARSLMVTNKNHCQMVQKATFLWEEWCHQQWPHLPSDVQFIDGTTATTNTATPNYSHLLRLAAYNQPTHVDSSCFMMRRTPLFRSIDASTPNIVQYLGVVGTGDRCIRSNAPLVRPNGSKEETKTSKRNLFKFLLHRKNQTPKPFVSPFRHGGKIMLTPRLVSYFEISILTDGPDVPREPHAGTPAAAPSVSDCVAIGLSTKSFRCFSRMPGWDAFSYGYHGDDGGIFHSSGDMLKRFGPSFGKGDTIGCGVSYHPRNGGIFFTLNGKFLGFAWANLDGLAQKELYPTVGVDSNAPVDCNFGAKEFKFNLNDFLKKEHTEDARR